jgi:hypothetical protein
MVSAAAVLASHHLRSLVESSNISPEVIEERGYFTANEPNELIALGFESYQVRVPALVIPVWNANGELQFHRIRPDNPRPGTKPGKVVKYEQPAEVPPALDVPRRCQPHLTDTSRRLWVVEGEKKADALASWGEVVIGLLGVWGWRKDGHPLPDWDNVHMIDREVYIAFDSDAAQKTEVRRARTGLAKYFNARGAK